MTSLSERLEADSPAVGEAMERLEAKAKRLAELAKGYDLGRAERAERLQSAADLRTLLDLAERVRLLDEAVEGLQQQLQEARDGARHQDEHILRLSREIEDANAEREDLDRAWEATGYLGNRGKITLAEQVSALSAEIENLVSSPCSPPSSSSSKAKP